MHIYNFSVNKIKKNFLKFSIILISIFIIMLFIVSFSKLSNRTAEIKNHENIADITEILDIGYSNFLQDVHQNLNNYIDKHYSICGFVYRMPDFTESQFVLARNMIINNNKTDNALVVGMLCESHEIVKYKNNDWIKCTGKIKEGNYKGKMPVLEVYKIEKIEKPENDLIKPPTKAL